MNECHSVNIYFFSYSRENHRMDFQLFRLLTGSKRWSLLPSRRCGEGFERPPGRIKSLPQCKGLMGRAEAKRGAQRLTYRMAHRATHFVAGRAPYRSTRHMADRMSCRASECLSESACELPH